MKSLLVFAIPFLTTFYSFGQATQLYCDFESECNIITIDTNLQDNLWQIGHTDKPGFSFETNCIATDTVSPYPTNNYSVFNIKIPRAPWDMWIDVQFYHTVDTDLGLDGGYIEISSDNGLTWKNIINSQFLDWQQNLYTDTNLLFDGTPGYSSSDHSNWPTSFAIWVMDEIDTLNLRFVFISDSIDHPRSGWCIDELGFQGVWEGIGEKCNKLNFELYPNPCADILNVRYLGSGSENLSLEFYNVTGNLQKSTILSGRSDGLYEEHISVHDLSPGMYFVKVVNENNTAIQKLLIK